MGKERFVDNNLVKIRGRLMEESNTTSAPEDEIIKEDKKSRQAGTVSIQDKEWKRAVFKRWDEYKALRRDVLLKLNETINSLPDERVSAEKRISDLNDAEQKLKRVLADVESLDDSKWDRYSLADELSTSFRKVENARMDCMLINSKLNDQSSSPLPVSSAVHSNSIIHEITSLTFKQCFKIGLGFLFPLILGMIIASLLFSLFYYISVH